MAATSYPNRKLQFMKMTRWFMEDFKSQVALSEASGIPQAILSGFLGNSPRTSSPSEKTKRSIVEFLSTKITPSKRSKLWTLSELESYLDSGDSPQVFLAKLSKAGVPEKHLSIVDRVDTLSDAEKFEAIELMLSSLKKNRILAA